MKIAFRFLLLLMTTTVIFSCGADNNSTTEETVAMLCAHECPSGNDLTVNEDLRQCYCSDSSGSKHGKFIEWYENGQKKIEREFWYGALIGLNQTWYENGACKGEFVWLIDDSFYIAFREMFNGHPILEGFYRDGLPYADWAFYDLTAGYKTMNAGFVDGVYCGTVQCYDSNGQSAGCADDVLEQIVNDGCELTTDGADCPECPAFYE
jgi:hypothetical protein